MAVPSDTATLAEVAAALAAPGKGLLASDESVGTIGKRLEKAGLRNDEVKSAALVKTTPALNQPAVLVSLRSVHS